MAEARRIGSLGEELKRGVRLSVSDEGVHVDLSFVVPPPRKMMRLAVNRLAKLERVVFNTVFPWSPIGFFLTVGVFVAIVVNAHPESWWRTSHIAHVVWWISERFPWFDVPLRARLGILAAETAMVGALIATWAQRQLLRLLLSWQGFLYQSRNPTLLLKVWFVAVRLLLGRTTPLLSSFQSALPTLPLPSLDHTTSLYLDHARALENDEEFAETQQLVDDFRRNEGPRLQRYLRMKWWFSTNYVTDWWEQFVYLRGRSSIMINSNYYVLDSAYVCPTERQESRAAMLVHHYVLFKHLIETERLSPLLIQDTIPLCMNQYHRMFSTTRIPGKDTDEIVHWERDSSKHIAVFCNGRFYSLPIYKSNGSLMRPQELERSLREIREHATSEPEPDRFEARIAALTAQNRTRWAEVREQHFSEGTNRRSLHTIESAILFLQLELDESEQLEWTSRGRKIMHGTGADHWFDKSISIVVFRNGRMGTNAEHSWADAPVVGHMMEWSCVMEHKIHAYDEQGYIRADLGPTLPDFEPMSACERGVVVPWHVLEWKLSRGAEEAIDDADSAAKAQIADLDLEVDSFTEYGKAFIKKCRVSPDAYLQMALQLAYFRDQERIVNTYEASMTRLFKHGRTETIRPVTMESCRFVHTMEDESKSPEEKLHALQAAAVRHVKTTHDSMAGKGIDRHLFALYVVSVGKEIDSPFLREALKASWHLSTSQQPQQQTSLWNPKNPDHARYISPGGGFGPVADDGYGVSYMISGEHQFFFHVSSKRSFSNTNSKRFTNQIRRALQDLKSVMGTALDREASGSSPREQAGKGLGPRQEADA